MTKSEKLPVANTLKYWFQQQFFAACAGMVFILTILWLYTIFVPPLLFIKYEHVKTTKYSITLRLSGYYIKTCQQIKSATVGFAADQDNIKSVPVAKTKEPSTTVVASYFDRQNFGEWTWGLRKLQKATKVKLTVQYQCNSVNYLQDVGWYKFTGK